MATTLSWMVLVLPLVSGLVLTGWPSEPPRAITRVLGIGSILVAFALSVWVFADLLGSPPEERSLTSRAFEWIAIGDVTVDLSILVDPLSVMMMLVITGVGFLIHLYSAEYMGGDRDYRRFFAGMNLFVFSMLLLVMAGNFLFLIVGWAFVGLASYLLIGFWYERPTAVAAAKKAFIVNVIGDVGLVLGAVLILRETGTLDYAGAFAGAGSIGADSGTLLAICLLLFMGAAAKSAQVPLHTWLPDAMEGPTPVSALIHAATMVTAGVYLVVRCHVFFDLSWLAGDIVAVVGAITLLMAATVALQQVDIKRVLAWSTISQVGYMIMAVGLGAYASGMFMLMAHAFFKAALFLAAGIVIHALHGEQNLDRMAGLRKHLRVAYFGMGAGCLAIAGVPGFAGFFAKDDVLASALAGGNVGVACWVIGVIGAFLTALYMFRLLFRAFFGPEPGGGYRPVPHPSRWWMSVPVVILGVLSIVGGLVQVPFGWAGITDWLQPVTGNAPSVLAPTHTTEVVTVITSSVVALAGIALAWWLFGADPARRLRLAGVARSTREVMRGGWRFDEVCDDVIVEPGRTVADVMWAEVEPKGPQGIITGTTALLRGGARLVGASQSGLVRAYAFWMVLGIVAVGIVLAIVVTGAV